MTTLAPFLTASAMCASTFSTAFIVDQRADHGTRLEPVGDLHRPGGLGEALRERVVDAVCTKMRLAQTQLWPAYRLEAIALPASRGQALDLHLDMGLVEDDERCVTVQTSATIS